MKRFGFIVGLLAVLAGIAAFGCVDIEFGGGDVPDVPAVPAGGRVVEPVAGPTVVLGKEFEKPERLVLPTLTSTPVVEEKWDGFGAIGDDDGELVDIEVTEPVPARIYREKRFDFVRYAGVEGVWDQFGPGGLLSCDDHYRRMLVGYKGRLPFGPEVAGDLSQRLLGERPDCGEDGWAPEFQLEPVCIMGRLGGRRLPETMVVREGSMKVPRALGTKQDDHGNVLVQFKRLPLVEAKGCWLFMKLDGAWAWFVSGVGEGVGEMVFPECDGLLRAELMGTRGEVVGAGAVVRLVEQIRDGSGGDCPSGGWDLYPREEGHDVCGLGGVETGWKEDGSLVVNWQFDYPAAWGSLCWVYRGEDDDVAGTGWRRLKVKGRLSLVVVVVLCVVATVVLSLCWIKPEWRGGR